jgi:cytoskeleton protein RodZ
MNEEGQHTAARAEPLPEATPVLPTLGELLVAARERWNLSAADVARQLRLGLRQVEGLESNHFEVLPGNTFVRGFIRNYAKVVQEEPAVFLDAYERCRPQLQQREIVAAAEHIEFTNKPTPRWVWYLGGVAVLLVTVPLLIYFALHDDELSKSRVARPAKMQPNQAHEAQLTLPPQHILPQSAESNAASGVAVTAPVPAATASPIMQGTALQAVPAAASGAPNLTMHFEGDAWVEIRDKSGTKIFSQLSRAGSEQVVQGTPPFALVVGNAARVRIAYNGKPVDLAPYIRVNVARFTLE